MKRVLSVSLMAFSSLAFWGCQPSDGAKSEAAVPQNTRPLRKAVFVLLDGIPADVIERVATPTLDAIAEAGGYSRSYVGGEKGSYNETPTISAPGYMSLITGTWGNKHNVWDNYNQNPNYHYPSIFHVVEAHDPDLKTAIFSTWEDNRTVLVGDGVVDSAHFVIDYGYDGFEKDTLRYPHDSLRNFIHTIDKEVAQEAAKYILEEGPDLSWVYLEYSDDIGHGMGDGEVFDTAVRKTEQLVAGIWESVQKRQQYEGEEWMILVTTDHGRDSITGQNHGGQSLRERTNWLVTNVQGLNAQFKEKRTAMVDIYPSLLRFMEIPIPERVDRELDGTPFLGPLSVQNLQATLDRGQLSLSWTVAIDKNENEKGRLLAGFTNDHATGGSDSYAVLAEEVDLRQGRLQVQLSEVQLKRYQKGKFLKLVLEAPKNRLNYWLIPENEPKLGS